MAKWWKRAAFHFLDMAVVNVYIVYKTSAQSKKLTHEQFQIELAKEMLLQASVHTNMPAVSSQSQCPLRPPFCHTEHHFHGDLPSLSAGIKNQKDCTLWGKKKGQGRKTTMYMCKQCQLPMCIIPCFELYHTKVDPQWYL